MEQIGVITTYLPDRGYGFIRSEAGDYFFHIKRCQISENDMKLGVVVTFEPDTDRQGRPCVSSMSLAPAGTVVQRANDGRSRPVRPVGGGGKFAGVSPRQLSAADRSEMEELRQRQRG